MKSAVKLEQLKDELHLELTNILHYWTQYTIDEKYGGFVGKINNENSIDPNADKGLVLNARILWTFSAAYTFSKEETYRVTAGRAFHYLIDHFFDNEYKGFYWSVNRDGNLADDKKQVYGIAFCCYGLAEYYQATGNRNALQWAKNCYRWIEQYSFDKREGGYLEAFAKDWQPLQDLRLSVKDANEKKTMNTHLHVLEAYTNLYRVWKDENLQTSIQLLLGNFIRHIVDKNSGHLHLFFDENWQVKSDIISYGHDIEAAWLLQEAAEAIQDKEMLRHIKEFSIKLTDAAAKGLDTDGGLWYEMEQGNWVKQKHWWPQAEALVGFFNAWQITNDEKYLQNVFNGWKFISQYMIDKKNGEWFWGINDDYSVMDEQDKVGFWKCPYHNTRMCMEISKRIAALNK